MASNPAGVAQLARFLTDNLLVLDIGCRWGFSPQWDALGERVSLIGFDADEGEIHRLETEYAGRPNTRFVARTLGTEPGRAVLYQTREPGASSVFKPDIAHMSHLPEWEGWHIDDEVVVEVTALDAWMASDGITRVDSMKLDTQGSELGILRGSEQALRTARHVEVEVSFNEIGQGAPLFGEVDAFLRDRGFALWRLRDLVHYALSEARNPLPMQEEFWYENMPQTVTMPGGQLVWCNAHFVRRNMYEAETDAAWEAYLRDALVSGAQRFNDLAQLALQRLLDTECPDDVRAAAAAAAAALAQPTTEVSGRAHGRAPALARLRRRLRGALARSRDH